MNNIEKYFNQEKFQCTIAIVISIVLISVSVYLLLSKATLLQKGFAYVSLPLSFLLLVICTSVVIKTPKDIVRITTYYNTEPQKILDNEIPRMNQVMNSFKTTKKLEFIFIIVGVCLLIFFWRTGLVSGIGFALLFHGFLMFFFDYFAEQRGEEYLNFLNSIKK
ncbi:MAG TPA: hypothetical protein VF465_17815 [Flavobacterium sp.]|uniref:hypothetical protein n=1 Tax=Flavobacterium sp. TaxID=239 RepID=UPI002ED6651E